MPHTRHNQTGFTLMEMVIVILLIGVISAVYFQGFGSGVDAQRFEETRLRMETIRKAIFGDPSLTNEGHRTNYGYAGDVGRPVVTLADLVTVGSNPAWTYSESAGYYWGWNGPYIDVGPTGAVDYDTDAWGNAFYYDTSVPVTLRSYGADNASGGSNYDTDLQWEVPEREFRFSSIRGHVMDGATPLANRRVSVSYVNNGAVVHTVVGVTTADGAFDFALPTAMGLRSVTVYATNVVTMAPEWEELPKKLFYADREEVVLPVGFLDYDGATKKVTYTASTLKRGADDNTIQATLANARDRDLVLSTVKVTWDADPTNLIRIGLNGFSQTVSITSAGTITVTARLVLFANQDVNIFELEFDSNGQSENPTVVFTYTNHDNEDSLTIS